MYIVVVSLLIAIVSGYCLHRNDERKQIYQTICVIASVAAVLFGLRLIPDWIFVQYAAHVYSFLIVFFYCMILRQVKRMLKRRAAVQN